MRLFRFRFVAFAFAAAAFSTAATAARAQDISLNRPGSGARAAGMGNAFIAVSDDGTAASWNPAGLSQLRKPELSFVYAASQRDLFLEGFRTRDLTAAFTNLKTGNTVGDVEFASAAVPFGVAGRPVTLQVGWRRLFQINARYEGDIRRIPIATDGGPESLIRLDSSADGSVDVWSVAGAMRIASRLSLGWSTDFYRGKWGESIDISEDPGIAGPTDFISRRTSNRIGDHTWNLGLLVAYPSVRVGVVYHGALRSDFEASESVRSSLAEPRDVSTGRDGAELRFPRSYGVGVAWLPRPLLRLALDFTYDEWKKYLLEGAAFSPNGPVSGIDGLPPNLSASRNTVTMNVGMERLFAVKERYLPLRLGFTREPQGARDPLLWEDATQMVLAGGTGLNSNSLKLDVALEYRWGSFRNSQSTSPVYLAGRASDFGLPPPPEAQGITRVEEWRLKVSLIYRVVNTEKISRAWEKMFGS